MHINIFLNFTNLGSIVSKNLDQYLISLFVRLIAIAFCHFKDRDRLVHRIAAFWCLRLLIVESLHPKKLDLMFIFLS